jgi:subtilisin family serine protease
VWLHQHRHPAAAGHAGDATDRVAAGDDPAPEGDYQITTGTSVAAAEASGIVALLLERNLKLTPADIRRSSP